MINKDILKRIDELQEQASLLAAMVPLKQNSGPGMSWEELDKAYKASQKKDELIEQLQKNR
jgi:hypothetical protein